MRVLLDTNVLLRFGNRGQAQHQLARDAITGIRESGHECVLVPQVLYEYWVVATRPAENNGLDMTTSAAETAVAEFVSTFSVLRDERGVFQQWRNLVVTHDIKGKLAHDARLVAAMLRHGVTKLLTFNVADFAQFASIEVFTPGEIASGTRPLV